MADFEANDFSTDFDVDIQNLGAGMGGGPPSREPESIPEAVALTYISSVAVTKIPTLVLAGLIIIVGGILGYRYIEDATEPSTRWLRKNAEAANKTVKWKIGKTKQVKWMKTEGFGTVMPHSIFRRALRYFKAKPERIWRSKTRKASRKKLKWTKKDIDF